MIHCNNLEINNLSDLEFYESDCKIIGNFELTAYIMKHAEKWHAYHDAMEEKLMETGYFEDLCELNEYYKEFEEDGIY